MASTTIRLPGSNVASLTVTSLGAGIAHVSAAGLFSSSAIVNADVSASAAIVASKLDLTAPGGVGTVTPGAGAFTTLSASTSLTLGGGTSAGSGVIRFPKASEQASLIKWNRNAGGVDLLALSVDTADGLTLGDTSGVAALYMKSSGAVQMFSSSMLLREVGGTTRHTVTTAAATTWNIAASTSLDLQYNGTSRHKIDSTGQGFFNATPVAQQAVGAAATDAATTLTLANNLRTALINLGLCTT